MINSKHCLENNVFLVWGTWTNFYHTTFIQNKEKHHPLHKRVIILYLQQRQYKNRYQPNEWQPKWNDYPECLAFLVNKVLQNSESTSLLHYRKPFLKRFRHSLQFCLAVDFEINIFFILHKMFWLESGIGKLVLIQSLTIAIVFELIYYTNGHPRAWLTSINIDPKCHAYLLY